MPALAALDLASQRQILRAGQIRSLVPGEYVWRLGQPAPRLHFLLAGRVHLRVRTAAREPLTITRARPGDLLCGGAPCLRSPYCCEAYCTAPCRTFAVPAQALLDLAGPGPSVLALLRALAARSVHVCGRIPDLAGAPLDVRLLRALRDLARTASTREPDGSVRLRASSRAHLAERCGVRIESVVRALGRLVARGAVRKDGSDLLLPPDTGRDPPHGVGPGPHPRSEHEDPGAP